MIRVTFALAVVVLFTLLHAPQSFTVIVKPAQLAVLRARWPDAAQIGLPPGAPTDAQLVQAYVDYGLADEVAATLSAKQLAKLRNLSANQCQAIATALGLTVTDLPCGGL